MKMISLNKVRSKKNSKKNEEYDIIKIMGFINEKCFIGIRILQAFEICFEGFKILTASSSGGRRRDHYDFSITVEELSTKLQHSWTVEHKGTQKKASLGDPPWKGGVQFYNGGMEKFTITEEYAKFWYDTFISSDRFREEFNISEDIPTPDYITWRNNDAKVQGNPKTEFGVALKKNVRDKLGHNKSLIAHRNEFVPMFINLIKTTNSEILETLKVEILEIAKKTLEQKDAWLEINGNIDSKSDIPFTFKWTKKLTISQIISISIDEETKSDFTGKVESDLGYPIKFIIRWGKGAGFSNLRMDLK
jgi:hypothetical protein